MINDFLCYKECIKNHTEVKAYKYKPRDFITVCQVKVLTLIFSPDQDTVNLG